MREGGPISYQPRPDPSSRYWESLLALSEDLLEGFVPISQRKGGRGPARGGGRVKEGVGGLIGGTEEVPQGYLAHEKQPLRRTLQ